MILLLNQSVFKDWRALLPHLLCLQMPSETPRGPWQQSQYTDFQEVFEGEGRRWTKSEVWLSKKIKGFWSESLSLHIIILTKRLCSFMLHTGYLEKKPSTLHMFNSMQILLIDYFNKRLFGDSNEHIEHILLPFSRMPCEMWQRRLFLKQKIFLIEILLFLSALLSFSFQLEKKGNGS